MVRSKGNRLTPRDSLLRFEGSRGCCGDRIRACCLPSLSEHVSAYHMAFKRPKVDRGGGGGGIGGDHLSAIINGTRRRRVALLRESLPPPPYGQSFVLRNGRLFLREMLRCSPGPRYFREIHFARGESGSVRPRPVGWRRQRGRLSFRIPSVKKTTERSNWTMRRKQAERRQRNSVTSVGERREFLRNYLETHALPTTLFLAISLPLSFYLVSVLE